MRQEARRKVEARTRIVALGTENRALFQEGRGQDLKTAALWEVRVRERTGETLGLWAVGGGAIH